MKQGFPSPLRAVIFDFDGVIADTMPDNFRAWQRAFEGRGVQIEAAEYFPLEGMGKNRIAEILGTRHGLPARETSAIADEKERIYGEINMFRVYPEIPDLLHALRRSGIALALVTGASRTRLNATLPSDLRMLFGSIVTSDDVQATKPDPEPFRAALAALNDSPAAALVVENAPLGITAAKAAGLFCVALCTTLTAEDLRSADMVLQNHAAFRQTLAAHGIIRTAD
jgi:beta-phosphoglucomutase